MNGNKIVLGVVATGFLALFAWGLHTTTETKEIGAVLIERVANTKEMLHQRIDGYHQAESDAMLAGMMYSNGESHDMTFDISDYGTISTDSSITLTIPADNRLVGRVPCAELKVGAERALKYLRGGDIDGAQRALCVGLYESGYEREARDLGCR